MKINLGKLENEVEKLERENHQLTSKNKLLRKQLRRSQSLTDMLKIKNKTLLSKSRNDNQQLEKQKTLSLNLEAMNLILISECSRSKLENISLRRKVECSKFLKQENRTLKTVVADLSKKQSSLQKENQFFENIAQGAKNVVAMLPPRSPLSSPLLREFCKNNNGLQSSLFFNVLPTKISRSRLHGDTQILNHKFIFPREHKVSALIPTIQSFWLEICTVPSGTKRSTFP
jgi:hypothetical protein